MPLLLSFPSYHDLQSQAHGDDLLCRYTILTTLGEVDDTTGMKLINAKNNCKTTVSKHVGHHCQTVVRVVNSLNMAGVDCTLGQLVTKCKCDPSSMVLVQHLIPSFSFSLVLLTTQGDPNQLTVRSAF